VAVAQVPVRYWSVEQDSARWSAFAHRPGDIVISTRSKHGTTWMQMICALLIFQSAELPAPLADLSPWPDWLALPLDELLRQLRGQRHRRFLKTHTPLDGLPLDRRVRYIVVARHPLDAAVSMYHQAENLNRRPLRQLISDSQPAGRARQRPPLRDWLLAWIDGQADPRQQPDSLPGVLHHLTDAWRRRGPDPVRLVHYNDLCTDLAGQMHALAAWLDLDVGEPVWPALVAAAEFSSMRARADQLVPARGSILNDNTMFFRRGRPGAAAELLGEAELRRYQTRVERHAPPDLVRWLHKSALPAERQHRSAHMSSHRSGDAVDPTPVSYLRPSESGAAPDSSSLCRTAMPVRCLP
jgi:aryl sulfotransferase